jgi:alkylation response protein AidB-like acyl-CoA dehydrogenase
VTGATLAQDQAKVMRNISQLFGDRDPSAERVQDILERQFDLGLAWVHFPIGQGGLGVSPSLQSTVDEIVKSHGIPATAEVNPIGYGMAAPTLLRHGRPEQVRDFLRPLFSCAHIWCQLFSEPGAGSDLASLATKAEWVGEHWKINGQKVWTTRAHVARYGLLLARTAPEQPKRRGITCFILDMHAPGVEVRPLRQMTGDAEFNEVSLTDVTVPDTHRLGELNEGWRVANTTLMNERVAIGGSTPPRGSGSIGLLLRVWREASSTNPTQRPVVARLWVEAESLRLMNLRSSQLRDAGVPGPSGSIGKLVTAELSQAIYSVAGTLLGPDAILLPEGYEDKSRGCTEHSVQWWVLRARANSIAGGTTEIMRNIIAERILGLPRSQHDSPLVPWRDLPKS